LFGVGSNQNYQLTKEPFMVEIPEKKIEKKTEVKKATFQELLNKTLKSRKTNEISSHIQRYV